MSSLPNSSRGDPTVTDRSGPARMIDLAAVQSGGLEEAAEEIARLNEALTGYQVYEELARGGQGIVYRALQHSTGRIVALKVLHSGREVTARHLGRFAREIELVARLRHNHVVAVYDSGVVLGRPFFAMEYIDGLLIDDYVLLNRPTVNECVALFVRVCRAVASVHQCGVIHRDLKPGNILVDLDANPHLLDFGFAKCFDDDELQSLSVAGQVIGTLPFLCPDQVRDKNALADMRSDVYALGVILYLLLTGEMPYPVNGSPGEVCRNIVEATPGTLERRCEPESESCAVGPISADLSLVVLKALAKERERRYQTADDFANDLARYLAGEVVEARSGHRWYLLRKTLRAYRWHVAISSAFALLLIGSLIGITVLWRKAEHAARTAQASLQMGALARLAGIQRDEGRIDDAILLYSQAIELAAQAPERNIAANRYLYTSHHGLAQLYIRDPKTLDAGRRHCELATALAQQLVRDKPEETEYQRLLAYSLRLEGRIAEKSQNWERAVSRFNEAAAAFQSLLRFADPDNNLPLEYEVGFSKQFLGVAQCRSGDSKTGMETLQDARWILQRVYDRYPQSMDYLMELCRTEAHMVEWHLRNKTPEDHRIAEAMVLPAIHRLSLAIEDGTAASRLPEAKRLLEDLKSHQVLLEKRLRGMRRPDPT
ncbi:MAG: O-antigen ligase C-terminal domain-containing protein [Planctomycetia bacterium]|nr:MAG: O-antigen ligase C-terminal domain-containing protein [Planctomycetia bacterium]